jgi:hypothetical protein
LDTLFVALAATVISSLAVLFFYSRGELLWYGDAQAHLGIARRMLDSRTPGYNQIGTVWLPLPHALIAIFAGNDQWWRTGLAGAFPSAAAFIAAVTFLYAIVKGVTDHVTAAIAAAAVFALNPNVLYLQSIAMNEVLFTACFTGLLLSGVAFARSQSMAPVVAAGVFALAGTWTRYEGWFVLPFAAVYFLIAAKKNRWPSAFLFCAIAGIGPLWWFAHNWWYFGDALEFYTSSQWSPKAIQGKPDYPGYQNWKLAWQQYTAAAELCAGKPLLWIGMAGVLAAMRWIRRAWWPLVLLSLPPLFYLWSMHSSGGTPIFVPHLWPNSYYNTRYGYAVIPLAAFCAGMLVAWFPRLWTAGLVIVAAVSVWLWNPSPENWITWKESQVNSAARRAWNAEGAAFLQRNYRQGTGIFTTFGDVTGIFRLAGIPLRDTLTWDVQPNWEAAIQRPDLFLHEEWAVAVAGDPVQRCLQRAQLTGPRYTLLRRIVVKGAPVIEIYRRDRLRGIRDNSVYEGARRLE